MGWQLLLLKAGLRLVVDNMFALHDFYIGHFSLKSFHITDEVFSYIEFRWRMRGIYGRMNIECTPSHGGLGKGVLLERFCMFDFLCVQFHFTMDYFFSTLFVLSISYLPMRIDTDGAKDIHDVQDNCAHG